MGGWAVLAGGGGWAALPGGGGWAALPGGGGSAAEGQMTGNMSGRERSKAGSKKSRGTLQMPSSSADTAAGDQIPSDGLQTREVIRTQQN